MQKLFIFFLPLFLLPFHTACAQQTLAHWNANTNIDVNSNGKVMAWTSAATAITATAVNEGLAPSIVVADSGLKNSNSVAFGPEATGIRYLQFPMLTIDTATIFLVGNLASITNHIHFFIGGGMGNLYQGGLWLGGTQANIPGFGWQAAPSGYAIRQANVEPTGWGVYAFTNNRLFYNGVQTGYGTTQWPALTRLTTLGGVPPGLSDISSTVNYFFKGKMSELFIFDGGLTDARIQTISDSLVTEYNPVLDLGPDLNICASQVHLGPQNPNTYKTYLWNTGATTRGINVTQNGTYWLQVTSFGKTQRDTIVVSGLTPQPVITPTTDQTICLFRDSATFINLTANPNFSFTWSTGDTADTLKVSSGGPIFLAAQNLSNGCTLYSDTVLLINKTRADFDNTPICPNTDASFLDLSTDLLGDTIVTWAWNFGDPSTLADTSEDTNGAWNYGQSGTYSVYLKVTSSDGCADSVAKNVTVKPTATANFNWLGACYGDPIQFFDESTPESGTQVTGYQWTFGPGIGSSFVNPAVTFDTADVYPVTLKIFTASGCTDTVLLQVPVNKGVNAAFSLSDSLCAGQPVDAVDQSQGVNDNIIQWIWRFGSNTPISGQTPQFSFQGAGNRIVRLTTTTSAGCADSVQKLVYVRPSPTAAFSFAVNGGTPPFTPTVSNQSTGAAEYAWDYGNGFTDFGILPTLPAFADTGTYTVYLAVANTEGCADTVAHDFVVFTGDRTLQLMNATCVLDGDYVTYTARVLNKGALEVNRITFGANLDYNSVLREEWEGSLFSGQVMEYAFNSSAKYFTSADFCCVRIENFNDTLTVQAPDDEICMPLTDNAWFSTAYPTPTDGVVTIDHTLPFADALSATLCNVEGKTIRTLFTDKPVSAGFGSSTADISDLRAGLYVVRFTYRDQNYSVKVLKK